MKRLKTLSILVGLLLSAATALASSPLPELVVPATQPLEPRQPAQAAPARSGDTLQGWCVLDFEGVENLGLVDAFYGPAVLFSGEWQGLVDSDVGGNGNFANEPSPETVAFTPDDDPTTIDLYTGTIDFATPVKGFGMYYASVANLVGMQLTVNLYDSTGTRVGQYTLSDTPINGLGDPTGAFTDWYAFSIVLTQEVVSRVVITGPGSYWAVDDVRYTCAD